MTRPNTGIGRRGNVRNAGVGSAPYSQGAAALQLPTVAIYLSTYGLTLADSDTTVSAWAPWGGGLAATFGSFTATARPAYNPTGGAGSRPLITSDGTDDNLVTGAITKGSVWTGADFGFVGKVVASGSTGDAVLGYSTGGATRFRLDEATSATLLRATTTTGAGTSNNSTTAETTTGFWSMDWDAATTTQNMRFTGAIESTSSPTIASYLDGGVWSIGSQTGAAGFCNVQAQAAYISTRLLTEAERTYLRALLTTHTGVSC